MERFTMPVAVHLFLIKGGQILLSRRYNTGYEDGSYSVPAGHVDGNETVIRAMQREAREEINLELDDGQLQIVQVMHRKAEMERIDYFFHCSHWSGEVINNEPEKCDDLAWFDIYQLPQNIVGYVRSAIGNYINHRQFTLYGW